jgi:hypothetical protein
MGAGRESLQWERLGAKIGHRAPGKPDDIGLYLQLFQREMVGDQRLFATKLTGEVLDSGAVNLSGWVMFQETATALERFLAHLEIAVEQNEIEVLPSKTLGANVYGLVDVPSVLVYDAPTSPRETLTEALYGDHVFLLRREADHLLVASSDGYIGYVAEQALAVQTREEFLAYQQAKLALITSDFAVPGGAVFPAGSRFVLASEPGERSVMVHFPDGSPRPLPRSMVTLENRSEVPELANLAITKAEEKLGSLYVWGGKTSSGVDCSGLVQSSYRALNVLLPRDAYMQAYMGELSATRWFPDGMRRGDLLFFLGRNGKINHVAIALGEGRYVEAAGKVKYGSLNPDHAEYDAKRAPTFAFAKRLIQ